MKINKQFLQISVVAFVLSLIRPIISSVLYPFTRTVFPSIPPYIFVAVNYFNALVIYAIAPILIFAVFYFIGKKPNQTLEMRLILFALLIGFIPSFFIGSIIYSAIMWELYIPVVNFLEHMLQSIILFFVAYFLAALAGLSIGQNKQKKLTPTSEPELS